MAEGDGEAAGDQELVRQEYNRRLIYSLLQPAVALADGLRVPLKEFATLAQLALCRRKKGRGLTQREVADELDVSSRSVDRLIATMRQNFFVPESEHELPRRVEFLLWSGPASEARLGQLLPEVEAEELEQALALLLEQGRVVLDEGRTTTYRVTRRANRLEDSTLAARVDGLNNLLAVLRDTVVGRFFREDRQAGARTVALRVRPQDVEEIERIYEEHVWPRLVELDQRAEGDSSAVELGLAMLWSPQRDGDDVMQNQEES